MSVDSTEHTPIELLSSAKLRSYVVIAWYLVALGTGHK